MIWPTKFFRPADAVMLGVAAMSRGCRVLLCVSLVSMWLNILRAEASGCTCLRVVAGMAIVGPGAEPS